MSQSPAFLARTFRAFRYRDFRLMWMGACASTIGTFVQQFAQSWLVYDLTKNPFYLGLDIFLGQLPIMMFSLFGGVFADRLDRRKMLLASQYIQMTCAFLLMFLFVFHVVHVWQILTLSFIVGVGQSFGGPAYSALLPALVGPEDISNAIAMNSIQFNLARILGPIIGGLAYTALGATWCFALNGLSYVAVIVSLFAIHVKFVPSKPTGSVLFSMKEGIRYIRHRDGMSALVVLAFSTTAIRILVKCLPARFRSQRVQQGAGDLHAAAGLFRRRIHLRRAGCGHHGKVETAGAARTSDPCCAGPAYCGVCHVTVAPTFLRPDVFSRRGGYGFRVVHAFAGATAHHRRHARESNERLQPGLSSGHAPGRFNSRKIDSDLRGFDRPGRIGNGAGGDCALFPFDQKPHILRNRLGRKHGSEASDLSFRCTPGPFSARPPAPFFANAQDMPSTARYCLRLALLPANRKARAEAKDESVDKWIDSERAGVVQW